MTEDEWLECEEPVALIWRQFGQWTERKVRLFAVAACQACPSLPAYDTLEFAVECGARLIEGQASTEELAEARDAVEWGGREPCESLNHLSEAVGMIVGSQGPDTVAAARMLFSLGAIHPLSKPGGHSRESYPYECKLLRDLHPFRPATFDPMWRTSTVAALAAGMYESRDFSPMPILADALQDAGCDNADILDHCRDPKQVHVRGCWVVDLVLGRA